MNADCVYQKQESAKKVKPMKTEDSFIGFLGNVIERIVRVFLWSVIISGVIIFTNEMPTLSARQGLNETYKCVLNNFYIAGNDCADDARAIDDFVDTLPEAFVKEFRDSWIVIIDDNKLTSVDLSSNTMVAGYTDWSERTIFITEQKQVADTLEIFVHELGHCFDFEYGSKSYSTFFKDIYAMYKDDFVDQSTLAAKGYATSSSMEFFAVAFKDYLLYPEHLNSVAPMAYKFIDSMYQDVQDIKYIYCYDFGDVANIITRLCEQ